MIRPEMNLAVSEAAQLNEQKPVLPGLVPGIHAFTRGHPKTWMAGTSPAKTMDEAHRLIAVAGIEAIAQPQQGRPFALALKARHVAGKLSGLALAGFC